MIESRMSLPEILLFAGTRVALGLGIGLLLSSRLNSDQRKAAGIALAVVGGVSTIPQVINIVSKRSESGLRQVA